MLRRSVLLELLQSAGEALSHEELGAAVAALTGGAGMYDALSERVDSAAFCKLLGMEPSEEAAALLLEAA